MRQRLQSGVGGSLRFLPPEARFFGPPTAAVVTLKRSSGVDLPTPVVGASASLDTFSQLLTEDADTGARRLRLDGAVGLRVGGTYLLTAADGEHVEVEIAAVNQGTLEALLADPLPRDVTNGDQLRGVEVSYALSGAQCPDPFSTSAAYVTATEAIAQSFLYRAAWHYTVAGTDYDADQLYEVRRRLLKPTLAEVDVTSLLPAPLAELEPNGVQAVRRAADTAWGDILDDLARAGFNPDLVMDAERLRAPHISRTLYRLGIRWGSSWREWTALQAKAYTDDLQGALQAGDWYDKREDEVQALDEVKWPTVELGR